jgi:predicted HNH restriction endonuclease
LVSAVGLAGRLSAMETFLLTWNPRKSKGCKPGVIIRQIEARRPKPFVWSCGRSLQIRKGARLYFMKQGALPRGIIGSAVALSDSRVDESWNCAKAKKGATSTYVNLRWLDMIDPAVKLPLDPSQFGGVMAEGHWRPQSSGTRIQPQVAKELERLWSAHVGSPKAAKKFEHVEADYVEGKQSRIYTVHRKRERDLRDAKFALAKASNGGRLECEVPGCGFDFHKVYGAVGVDYAHVHHLTPLSRLRGATRMTVEDVAVVCANCHDMIHRGGECRPLKGLVLRRKAR